MKRLAMLAALLGLGVAACSDGTSAGSGRTQVYLTDSPFPYGDIARVDVYIARIEATASTDTSYTDPSSWVTIATPERVFNLLDFQGGSSALVGEADLPADKYSAVRLVINTDRSAVVRNNGSEALVHWPVSGQLSLYAMVEEPLNVPSSGAQIVIDFDVGRTFMDDGTGGFYFLPWIRAVNEAATGTIRGTVTAYSIEGDVLPMQDVAVSVYYGTSQGPYPMSQPLGSGRTDAQGHYAIAFIRPGTYQVIAEEPAFPRLRAWKSPVQVSVGAETQVNLLLELDTTGTGGGGGGGPDTSGVDSTGTPTGPVASVTTSPGSQTISVGDSAGVMAMTWNANNQVLSGRTVTWSLSDSSIVSITQAAYNFILLRGAKSGNVTLTATSEGKSGTASIAVR
jgi:hypothetical protein